MQFFPILTETPMKIKARTHPKKQKLIFRKTAKRA